MYFYILFIAFLTFSYVAVLLSYIIRVACSGTLSDGSSEPKSRYYTRSGEWMATSVCTYHAISIKRPEAKVNNRDSAVDIVTH
jgi:hypothetical protein